MTRLKPFLQACWNEHPYPLQAEEARRQAGYQARIRNSNLSDKKASEDRQEGLSLPRTAGPDSLCPTQYGLKPKTWKEILLCHQQRPERPPFSKPLYQDYEEYSRTIEVGGSNFLSKRRNYLLIILALFKKVKRMRLKKMIKEKIFLNL